MYCSDKHQAKRNELERDYPNNPCHKGSRNIIPGNINWEQYVRQLNWDRYLTYSTNKRRIVSLTSLGTESSSFWSLLHTLQQKGHEGKLLHQLCARQCTRQWAGPIIFVPLVNGGHCCAQTFQRTIEKRRDLKNVLVYLQRDVTDSERTCFRITPSS